MRAMLEEDYVGRGWVWEFRRSMTEIRLPTEEMRRVLFEEATFPPLYGAPRRF